VIRTEPPIGRLFSFDLAMISINCRPLRTTIRLERSAPLGVEQGTEGVPVGFKEIRLRFDIDTDAPQSKLDQLLELTDRYCVVFQTIQNSPKTAVKVRRRGLRRLGRNALQSDSATLNQTRRLPPGALLGPLAATSFGDCGLFGLFREIDPTAFWSFATISHPKRTLRMPNGTSENVPKSGCWQARSLPQPCAPG